MQDKDQTIARLREEKKLMLAALHKVEDWAFGEGYYIGPHMQACFDIMRMLGQNPHDAAEHPPLINWKQMRESHKPVERHERRKMNLSPEQREVRAERMRNYHREYQRKRKEKLAEQLAVSE